MLLSTATRCWYGRRRYRMWRSSLLPLLCCICFLPIVTHAIIQADVSTAALSKSTRWYKYLNSIYQQSDLDKDGTVSFNECYERVLLFYIKLNQQAHIAPPSRATVLELYRAADWNHDKRLDREEFSQLATTLARRASVRLVAHKGVTLFLSPWLATMTVRKLVDEAAWQPWKDTKVYMELWVHRLLPVAIRPTVLSPNFWKVVFLIVFVGRLGNLVLKLVDWFLDTYKPFATRMHLDRKRRAELREDTSERGQWFRAASEIEKPKSNSGSNWFKHFTAASKMATP